MVLRSLRMYGFKSFAEKLDLEFGDGITCIIGPNGCGKSNIVDAIRWVFGEQKASSLRSGSMQDIIFSGTQNRHPINMAEVTLTIENNKSLLPEEYSEVSITRRIHRSGESEYLLNRVPCRLKDIQHMFFDTGVGNTAYTTIENIMINQILSDKAEERRMLIDEAAGISKYKQRRKESQRQLDRTRQNLLRINDQVQETERHVRMLARHVEKARRYKRYFDELKDLETRYENTHYTRISSAMAERSKQLDDQTAKREHLRARIATRESEIEKMELEASEREKELQGASVKVAEAGEAINRTDREISVTVERLNALRERSGRLSQELNSLAGQVEERTHLKEQIEHSKVEREAKREKYAERIRGAQEELSQFDDRMSARREESERVTTERIECMNAIGEARNTLSNLEAQLNNAVERNERSSAELSELQQRVEQYTATIEKSKEQLRNAIDANERLMQSRETLSSRIEKEDERYKELVEKEKRCEAKIDSSKSQLKFLAGLDAAFEGYESGVKELLTTELPGTRGIVADCINVTDEATIALIERVLGSAIQTVVFENDESLNAAMGHLKEKDAGAARMISLERLNRLTANREQQSAPEGAVCLAESVSASEEMNPLVQALLGNIYVVDSGERAMALAPDNRTGSVFAARDGVICYADATVVAGTSEREEAGILQRKAQMEKLQEEVDRLEKELQTLIHERDICVVTRDEAKRALAEVEERISRGRQEQQEQETTIKHHENEVRTTMTRVETLQTDTEQTQKRIDELKQQVDDRQSEVTRLQEQLQVIERNVEESKVALEQMDSERRALVEHLKNVELELHGLTNRISQDASDIERLTKEVKDYDQRRELIIEEQKTAASSMTEMETGIHSLKEQLANERQEREKLEGEMTGVRELYNGILNEVDGMRKEAKAEQSGLEQLSESVHNLQISQTRDEDERRRIRERVYEAYEIDLEAPDEPIPALEEEEKATLEQIGTLRERIKRVGQVNMAALDDFETENARLQDLTRQRDDLETAVGDLEKAIRKLDKEARTQFLETFAAVQKNFNEMFVTLFDGGEAHLSIQEDVDPLQAEIYINVRPTGKKMRGVQLLSGGERALTAIALLFGLYQVKPSAYCILDELDAPLDDANVDRFIRLLRKFAERTQFIVVTHNKRTMEPADILYGVTQRERGVSTVASMKLDEAMRHAA